MLNNSTRDKILHKFMKISSSKMVNTTNRDYTKSITEKEVAGENIDSDESDTNNIEVFFHGEKNFEAVSPNMKLSNEDICIYSIKNKRDKPFIVYFLHNNNDTFEWLNVKNFKNTSVDTLQRSIRKEMKTDIILRGKNKDNAYNQLWFEIEDSDINMKHVKRSEKYISCLVSEIVNKKKYLNMNISSKIREFLLTHPEYIFLFNEQNKKYEIPEVGYYGNYYKKIGLVAGIGLSRETPLSSFGSYYYFAGYERAMRYAMRASFRKPMYVDGKLITVDDIGTYTRGGLVRFALFLGESTCMLGRETDKEDDSLISKELREKKEFYKLTSKYRDSDGLWTQKFDSVSIGKIKLDCKSCAEKEIIMDPQITVKKFEQQFPLSYYFVDTSQTIIDNDLSKATVE